ncbi:CLUMA_CG006905, isoform A [Clunio marinus]|uniref:CLUMA_CG006905, isoform A n=1 Tax=Clunio marinus TaxID=568069 RepID=A0A1J1I196_9DIPT|nr:CLUMA_CG006905, isoform A [Clunio marinus]
MIHQSLRISRNTFIQIHLKRDESDEEKSYNH